MVLGEEVDLFAAVRPLLDSEMLQVRWSKPADAERALGSCAPWPWGVAGTGAEPPPGALQVIASKPILCFWLGDPPGPLLAAARTHTQWRALVEDVRACVGRSLAGLTLAPNRGLLAPGGNLVLSAALEGLLSSSPEPLTMSSSTFRAAARVLARHPLPLRLRSQDGAARLEAQA